MKTILLKVSLFSIFASIILCFAGCSDSPNTNSSSDNSSSPSQIAGYLCQSPACGLFIYSDSSATMGMNGDLDHGHWSKSGGVITYQPNMGAPSRFAVQDDGSLVETKYGYKFEKLTN